MSGEASEERFEERADTKQAISFGYRSFIDRGFLTISSHVDREAPSRPGGRQGGKSGSFYIQTKKLPF